MNWYYVEQGKQAGPIDDGQFDEMLRSGRITGDTLVWHEGMADWKPSREVKAGVTSSAAGPGAPEAVCAECGKIFPIDDTIRYGDVRVCASCKPVFLQKLQEGTFLHTGGMRYAGFWIRLAAVILDRLIIGVPLFIVYFVTFFLLFRPVEGQPPQVDILQAFLPWFLMMAIYLVQVVYEIFFLGRYGATFGKMICQIKVVAEDGAPITYRRATGRAFSKILSESFTCDIGCIIAAFDFQKRALHDYICSTRVVHK